MKKQNYRKSGKKQARINQRKTEATERNLAWQELTPKEQLKSLDDRGLIAKRQRARINEILQNS